MYDCLVASISDYLLLPIILRFIFLLPSFFLILLPPLFLLRFLHLFPFLLFLPLFFLFTILLPFFLHLLFQLPSSFSSSSTLSPSSSFVSFSSFTPFASSCSSSYTPSYSSFPSACSSSSFSPLNPCLLIPFVLPSLLGRFSNPKSRRHFRLKTAARFGVVEQSYPPVQFRLTLPNRSLFCLGTLMIVDPEEEFFPAEITKLRRAVLQHGLSILVFAGWYNTTVQELLRFYDSHTRRLWSPPTGGTNVPALNDLLAPLGIQFGDTILSGEFSLGNKSVDLQGPHLDCVEHLNNNWATTVDITLQPKKSPPSQSTELAPPIHLPPNVFGSDVGLSGWGIKCSSCGFWGPPRLFSFMSGTNLLVFPEFGPSGVSSVLRAPLVDIGAQIIGRQAKLAARRGGQSDARESFDRRQSLLMAGLHTQADPLRDVAVPVLGLWRAAASTAGRVGVLGDSACLDSINLQKNCFWLVDALLDFTSTAKPSTSLEALLQAGGKTLAKQTMSGGRPKRLANPLTVDPSLPWCHSRSPSTPPSVDALSRLSPLRRLLLLPSAPVTSSLLLTEYFGFLLLSTLAVLLLFYHRRVLAFLSTRHLIRCLRALCHQLWCAGRRHQTPTSSPLLLATDDYETAGVNLSRLPLTCDGFDDRGPT
ncbi:unnamed protein product [Schistocephalus solidus]|uniref:MBTPS1 fourth domain-containing protein n=1 Tax=Schistocephalus solidus TaxID=70667 RepID=A0A3P7E587_SCHSO|nr:unnamed protein product [Schistocephalus solidus]